MMSLTLLSYVCNRAVVVTLPSAPRYVSYVYQSSVSKTVLRSEHAITNLCHGDGHRVEKRVRRVHATTSSPSERYCRMMPVSPP